MHRTVSSGRVRRIGGLAGAIAGAGDGQGRAGRQREPEAPQRRRDPEARAVAPGRTAGRTRRW